MDADLQHDERILPDMLRRLRAEELDLVVGSRHVDGGGLGEWSKDRVRISGLATRASRLLIKSENVSDPMSGFFMLRRETFDGSVRKLSSQGFKILLDILASVGRPLKIGEVGYTFRTRTSGESKLDSAVAWEYLTLLIDKLIGRWVPVRFVMFAAVGGAGLIVHMAILGLAVNALSSPFLWAQTAATMTAMTFNFFVNNALTYRDRRLKGWRALTGLLMFYLICSVGAVANVGIANFMFGEQYSWWLSGVAGVLVGSVWNYAISSIFTWGKK
jgi:dolichol-phosphate mannosyltransferase